MRRAAAVTGMSMAALLLIPAPAFAIDFVAGATASPLRLGMSLLGLVVAAFLLVEAFRVRDFAAGGAIAEKISYVVLAIICLAASALARWAQNFVSGVTLDQVVMASEALVIVAMVLLAIYFASVRRALQGYLKAMTGSPNISKAARIARKESDREEDLSGG